MDIHHARHGGGGGGGASDVQSPGHSSLLVLPPSGPHAFAHAYDIEADTSGAPEKGGGQRSRGPSVIGSTAPSSTTLPAGTGVVTTPAVKEPYTSAYWLARLVPDDDPRQRTRALRAYYAAQNELVEFCAGVEGAREAAEAERERARCAAGAGADAALPFSTDASPAEAGGSDGGSVSALAPRAASAGGGTDAGPRRRGDAGDGSASPPTPTPASATTPRDDDAVRDRAREARAISVARAINLSFIGNIVLLAIKIYAAASSSSLAVIASTVDSVLDLLSGFVVWLSARLAAKRNHVLFPVGKSRYEPVAIIIFAAVMGVASLQIIEQGVVDIAGGVANGAPASFVDERTFGVLAAIIVVKAALLAYCYGLRKVSTSVGALALDHLADVVTNAGTLIAVLVSWRYANLWWFDPGAAIGLAVWMVIMWGNAAREQVGLIASQAASREQLCQLTYVAMTHSPSVVAVDTVLAYQVGNRLQVEIDVVMPKTMLLIEAHDIGESLQRSVEELEFVERTFVHLDTDWLHSRDEEHVNVYDL